MPIDLGVDFDTAEKESRPAPIPDGNYEFQVVNIEDITSGAGRPGWRWWLMIINRPEFVNRRLAYNTYFPWIDPATGQRDAGGLGMLVAILDGINAKWSGTTLPDKETFYGRTGIMKVTIRPERPNPNDPENPYPPDNRVAIITKRKGNRGVA